jgi:hypothetical protein
MSDTLEWVSGKGLVGLKYWIAIFSQLVSIRETAEGAR